MRRTFVDDDLQREFEDSGMVVLSLFSDSEIERLRDLYETHALRIPSTGFQTNYSADAEKRRALSRAALEFVSEKLMGLLSEYRLAQAVYMVKNPGDEGVLAAHTDPSLVDEDLYRSIVVWIPVMDVNEENGCLWVLPGTHRETPPWRCAVQDLFQVAGRVIASDSRPASRPVPLNVGQVLMFHPGTVHGSGPNKSNEVRVALQLYGLPEEAETIQCRMNAEGMIERYRVNDDYMLDVKSPEFNEGGELIDVIDRDGVATSGRRRVLRNARARFSGTRARSR